VVLLLPLLLSLSLLSPLLLPLLLWLLPLSPLLLPMLLFLLLLLLFAYRTHSNTPQRLSVAAGLSLVQIHDQDRG
jgi:hypothetical protein